MKTNPNYCAQVMRVRNPDPAGHLSEIATIWDRPLDGPGIIARPGRSGRLPSGV